LPSTGGEATRASHVPSLNSSSSLVRAFGFTLTWIIFTLPTLLSPVAGSSWIQFRSRRTSSASGRGGAPPLQLEAGQDDTAIARSISARTISESPA